MAAPRRPYGLETAVKRMTAIIGKVSHGVLPAYGLSLMARKYQRRTGEYPSPETARLNRHNPPA